MKLTERAWNVLEVLVLIAAGMPIAIIILYALFVTWPIWIVLSILGGGHLALNILKRRRFK